MLLQRDGKAIPAQAYVLEKHPDGSAKTAAIHFIIDKLDKDATTHLTADFEKEGPSTRTQSERKSARQITDTESAIAVRYRV